jgi:putative hydrolase of the HAD superfamily
MITNIVFDMGNTLIYWDPSYIAGMEKVPAEEADYFIREMFWGKEWTALDHGTIEDEAAIASINKRLPRHLQPAVRNIVTNWWRNPLLPVPGMEELVRELKAEGYGIYLLSNASLHLHDYFHLLPAHECFDGVIVSADWKQVKPSHELYEIFYRKCSVNPAECIFIDDLPLNVDGALITGMDGIIFHNDTARLRRELKEAGVRVKTE